MTRSIFKFLFLVQLLVQISQVLSFSIPLNGTDKNGCKIGEEFRQGSCKLCEPGTYRFLDTSNSPTSDRQQCPSDDDQYDAKIEPSSDRCLPCPAGTYNPFRGVMSVTRCRPCPAGTTSVAGSVQCTKCPGQKSSVPGSSKCTSCPKGSFLVNKCVSGTRPKSECSKCPLGTYSTKRNSAGCEKCPEGTSTAWGGATSKQMCRPCGSHGVRCSCRQDGEPWGEVSSYRPIGHSVCTRCPPGTRARNPYATRASQCEPCPNGSSYVYLEGCKPCSKGTFSFGRGADYCRAKRDDKCPFDSIKAFSGVCHLCAVGYRRDGARCVKCPSGTVSQGYTSTKCTKCVFPEIAPQNGGSFCECGRNYYKDYGNTYNCVPCPKGTKLDKAFHSDGQCEPDCENFPTMDACIACKDNFERDYKTQKCVKCEEGLVSLDGEGRCTDPRTGCGKGQKLAIEVGRFGYFLSC